MTPESPRTLIRNVNDELRATARQLETLRTSERLGELNGTYAKADLRDLTALMSQLRKEFQDLSKTVPTVRRKRKQCVDKQGGGSSKKIKTEEQTEESERDEELEELTVQFGGAPFFAKMGEVFEGEQGTCLQFLKSVFETPSQHRINDLASGIEMVVKGAKDYDKESIDKRFSGSSDTKASILADFEDFTRISELTGAGLSSILKANNRGHTLNSRSEADILKVVASGLRALRFALGFGDNAPPIIDDKGKPLNKCQKAYFAGLRAAPRFDPGTGAALPPIELSEVDWKAAAYKTHYNKFNDYKRGCNKYLALFEVLGSLVLLCPQLRFQEIVHDTRIGKLLTDALDPLDDLLDAEERERREKTHRRIVNHALRRMEGSGSKFLSQAFRDIEDALDTFREEREKKAMEKARKKKEREKRGREKEKRDMEREKQDMERKKRAQRGPPPSGWM